MTPMEDHPMEESMSSIIEKMLKTHLPKLKVYFMMMREPQALKYTQTEANFKEEEVCVELKHRIKKTKRQAYHLKMAHQRLNLKDEQFEHHMEELDVYFILMEVLARIYQTPVPSTTRDEVLERLKINVEAIKLLVKSIKRYLKNLKAGAAQEHHDFGGDQGDDQDGADTSNRPFSSSRGGRGASRGGRGRGRGTRGGYSKRPHHDSDAVNPNGESSSQDFASGSVAADEQPKKRSKTQEPKLPEPVSSPRTWSKPRGRPLKNAHQNDSGEGTSTQVAGPSHAMDVEEGSLLAMKPKTKTQSTASKKISAAEIGEANRNATFMCLQGADSEKTMTEEIIEKIETMVGVSREVFHNREVQIDVSVAPADIANYRGCDPWTAQLVTPECTDSKAICKKPGEEDQHEVKRICEARMTGELHVDLKTVTAEEISQIVREKGVRGVYTPRPKGIFPTQRQESGEIDTTLYLEELKMFEEKHGYTGHNNLGESERLQSPATVINVTSASTLEEPNFKQWTTEAPLAVVRGLLEVCDVDCSQFTLRALLDAMPDGEVELSSHLIEKTKESMDPSTGQQLNFRAVDSRNEQKTSLKNFVAYYEETQNISEEGIRTMSGPSASVEAFNEITEQLVEAQKTHLGFTSDFVQAHFAINFDVDSDEFHQQQAEIAKLPAFIQPNYGLLGSDSLKNIGGVTSGQMYLKVPGCRTYSHVENSNLGSINANVGQGTCAWFVVSYEYAGDVARLMEESGRNRSSYEALWPFEETIRNAGIPIQTVIQQPGDVVHVAPGSFHWVESLGFTVNLSWNVGQLTNAQLQAAVIHHDHCLDYKKGERVIVPLEDIVWDLAEKKEYGDSLAMAKTMKAIMVRALARAEHEHCWWTKMNKMANVDPEQEMRVRKCKRCAMVIGNATFLGEKKANENCFGCKGLNAGVLIRRKIEDLHTIFDEFCGALPGPLPDNPDSMSSQPSTSQPSVPNTSDAPFPVPTPSSSTSPPTFPASSQSPVLPSPPNDTPSTSSN